MAKRIWENYEDVTRQLLEDTKKHLKLSEVEGKQQIHGKKRSGTDWEIEAVAKRYENKKEEIILVECKCWSKSRLSQELLGGFAYRILDAGAQGGIIVTTIGLQEGAKKVAKAEKITEITLDTNSTNDDYIAQIGKKFFFRITAKMGKGMATYVEVGRGEDGKPVVEKTEMTRDELKRKIYNC